MKPQKLFLFIFLFIFLLVSISYISGIVVNRDRSLDGMIGKVRNINANIGFNYDLTQVPSRIPVRFIERQDDYVIGNAKVIIITPKENIIDYENGVFNSRYLSVPNTNLTTPVKVIMWVGTEGVLYGIKTDSNTSKSYNEIANNGTHLFNVLSQDGYVEFELDSFSATISGLPDWFIPFSSNYTFNVDTYSTNSAPSSTFLTFANPDTETGVTLFDGQTHTNSKFTIRLGSTPFQSIPNQLWINSSTIEMASDLPVTVHVCDIPFSSCPIDVKDTFDFQIKEPIPFQATGPIPNQNLGTSGSATIFFGSYFATEGYDYIIVNWEDDDLMQTVNLQRTKTQTSIVSADGEFYAELKGTGSNVRLDITSKNLSRTANVFVTAGNSYYGRTTAITQGFFIVNTTTSAPSGNPPVQIASILSANMTFNDEEFRTISSYYVNFTSNMTFLRLLNSTSGANISVNANQTKSLPELNVSLSTTGGTITVNSKTTTLSNYRIYINVCNSNGCIGNTSESQLRVDVTQAPASQVASILPISMGFNADDFRNTENYFTNYINSTIRFINPANTSQNITLLKGEQRDIGGFVKIGYTNTEQINVHSYTQNLSFNIFINVTDGTNYVGDNLLVTISAGGGITTPPSGSVFNIGGLVDIFRGIFPDASGMTIGQKAAYVIVFMLIVTAGLMIIAHTQTGGIPTSMIYIIGAADALLFFFFVAIKYIPIIVPLFIVLVAGAIVFFRVRGGK